MLSNGGKAIGGGGAVGALCFFLPWVLVSCGGQPVATLSGWQLAAGGTIKTAYGSSPIPGSAPELFLVLLAALGCIGLVALVATGQLPRRTGAYIAIGLAAVSVLIMFVKLQGAQSGQSQALASAQLQYGFWGSLLAYVAVIVGAVIDLGETKGEAPGLQATGPGSARFCMHCGQQMPEGARFCMSCGRES